MFILYDYTTVHGAKYIPFTTVEVQNIRIASDNNNIQQGILVLQLRSVPILS